MKTSEEIYNRIMTDPNLNKNLFVIMYKDVVKKKYIDVPAVKWLPIAKGGDVPYHRVDFIKYDGKIIWDRIDRICIIDQCVINSEDEILPCTFKIVTFNVLSDEYEKNVTNINKRMKNIMDFIFSDNSADIICLQEVQPILLTEIKKYATADSEHNRYIAHTTMNFNDIVIITKIKQIFSETIDLGQQKSAILVNLKLENDRELNIVGVHLTSDYYDDSSKKRISQLFKIKQKLIGKNNVILLGDTNEMVYEHNLTHFTEYCDTWLDLKSSEKCFTYNPSTNVLAKKLSKNKTPVRLDRILYTKNGTLTCNDIQMNSEITFSDHYPLIGNFTITEQSDVVNVSTIDTSKTTNQTALCIIPPYELWKSINDLKMAGNDKHNLEERWMPHLNLFFGFTQPEYFYEISKNIEKLQLQPFEIEFNKIGYFTHERTFTLFLKPSDESIVKLRQLHSLLNSSSVLKLSCFDAKVIFSPHITLGNSEDEQKIINLTRQQVNIKFNVNNINFVSRIGYEYFKVIRNVQFVDQQVSDPMDYYIEFVRNVTKKINVECVTCGSRIFGIQSDKSDADLLCTGTMERDKFFGYVIKIFETCGLFRKVYTAKNKYVYCLKLKTSNNNIDIQYVNTNDPTDTYYKTGLAMLNEPKYIIEQMGSKMDLFRECLVWLRTELKRKKMYSAIHCFIGGLSIAILVGAIIKSVRVTSLVHFIVELKQFDFSKPISIGYQNVYKQENPCDRLLYIGTSTTPIENTVRHICKSTALLLKEQFSSGFDNSLELDTNRFIKTITFTIVAIDDDSLEDCIVWFNGIVTSMIVAIERNSKDIILFPSNCWDITNSTEDGEQLSATWKLKSSEDYASLHYTANKVVEKSKTLFVNAFLSYQ